jgi:hypothetical protein
MLEITFILIKYKTEKKMSGFDEREKAFESKFALDEKLDFAVEARTSKLFGLWAAEKLGLTGPDANTYAIEVVGANLEEVGFQDVIRKVRKDFDSKGVDVSDHIMDVELQKALVEAQKQVKS